MKPAPSKYSTRNTTKNQNVGRIFIEQNELRAKALEVAKNTSEEIKKAKRYDLKR
jgi:hypothetical protein